MHTGGAAGALLSSEKHAFLELDAEYRSCAGPYTGTGNEKFGNAREFFTETKTGTGTVVTRRNWVQRTPVVWANDVGLSYNAYLNEQGHAQDQPPNDDRITWEETTLEDGKVKRVEYGYDQFNNVTSIKEYDFGTTGSPGSLLRQTFRTYVTALNGSCYSNLNPSDSTCGNALASDVTSIIYQPSLLLNETVKDSGNVQKSYSEFEYDNYTADSNHHAVVLNSGMTQYDGSRFSTFNNATQPRGNVTKTTRWLSGGTDVVAYSQYDNAGQVVWSKDANGNVSTVSYTDNFGIGNNPEPAAGVTGPAGPTYALASVAWNALGHQVKMQYNYSLGTITGVKDANGVITKTEYDSQGRPFRATTALELAEQSISQMSYPTAQENAAKVSKQLDATRWLASKTDFDGFDRPFKSWQAEDGQQSPATFSILVHTEYDPVGRVKRVSNPYRPATESPIYTTTSYDLAGRVVTVTTPDDAVVTTSYSANTVTVSDQAGKQRKSITDALGRLKEVYEDPNGLNYLTSYAYDTLDNLTSVSQGTQTRTFVYDSLKRLKSATNPESGTICYGTVIGGQCQANGYDANGNLVYKTDARGVLSTYAYDVLNRNTSVVYSNDPAGTPAVHRYYDGFRDGVDNNIPYSKGRLWQTETGGATASRTTLNSFDALGRPLSESQQFYAGTAWSQPFTVQRNPYNLAGGVTSQTYPSGHTVSYNYDNAGRVSSLSGNLGDGTQRSYSTEIIYSPLGGMTKEKFGTDTALYNKLFYNSRGQLAEIREGTSYTGPNDTGWERGAIINYYGDCWGMCGGSNSTTPMANNNGNLKKQEIFVPGASSWLQQYDYDNLNRLQGVSESAVGTTLWRQEYVYDRYGNRTIHQTNTWGTGIPKPNFGVATASNRLTPPAGYTMSYDDAGNLTNDTYTGAGSRTYDAENRMTQAWANGQWQYYTYNADGQRVRRKVNGVETWQVYGFGGELLAAYAQNGVASSAQQEYGYRNGQLLVTATRTNVAAAANGGVASASSSLSGFPAGGTNNGDRKGTNWGSGGGWADASSGSFPDWLQIDFNGSKTINEVDVFTLQNNYASPSEPTETMTFSTYGLTAYDVQYWNGSAWVTVTGGSITGNNKVWRKVTFSSVTTSKIRVLTNAAIDNGYSRITEVEAWGGSSGAAAGIQWLVTDQLGTPRMVFDKTGALETVKRHDYLPFGEEVSAGVGQRTTTLGYGLADGVRQKFTQKERDIETGLDYFLARYYSSIQGRFTSVDPQNIIFDKNRGRNGDERARILQSYIVQPQNWNRYAYTRNNPLAYTDPNGRCSAPAGLAKGNVGICIEAFIASPHIKGIGRGDNRDFAPNDPSKTYRVRVQGLITRTDFAWQSELHARPGRSDILIEGLGLKGGATLTGSQSVDKEGNLHLRLQITGTNAFSGLPGAPEGHIQINVNLIVTPDGRVGIEGGDRTAYPSTGLYVYTMGADGKPAVATLGEGRETTPAALTQPLVPIQPVPPTCNCPKPEDEERRRNRN